MHDPIGDPWGPATPIARGETWPERVDQHLAVPEDRVERWVQTASILHSDGDAMDIAASDGRIAGVRGRGVDRVNRGRLGPRTCSGGRPTTPRTASPGRWCAGQRSPGTTRWGEEAAAGLGAAVDPDSERDGGRFSRVREKASEALGSRPAAGAMLLADLRRFLAMCSDASIACIVLAQGAQAARDRELLEAVTAAHDAVLRTHRRALTRLKVTAPQVLLGP